MLSPEAMERATYVTKSFLIALALVKRHLTAEQAAVVAQVEVASQIERWGEVEDCEFQSFCRGLKFAVGMFTDQPRSAAHDVDYHDVRRQLGSAACLITNMP